jgi:uncharacterized protein YbjT (DUF2867 family)
MSQPILVTGAAGGKQGSTGRHITELLTKQGLPVRAFVHKMDERSEALRALGAEVVQGDLLDPTSVRPAFKGIKRAYFTYPVDYGLLEATTIFAAAAREAEIELVVNLSQLQSTEEVPTFRNLQHRLADRIFDWAEVGAVHLHAPPFFENVRALVAATVASQNTVFLPWGEGSAVIPLIGAEDVARVGAALLMGPATGLKKAYRLITATPSVSEIVSTLGAALKRSIRYVAITDEQWKQALEGRINSHALDHLSRLWAFFRNREGRNLVQVTSAVSDLTGSSPQTLEQFFRANASVFGAAAASA